MGEQQVMTGVELVRLGQAEIRTQQVGHGAVAEPFAMQPPLTAGFNQPVGDQDLQNLVPARSLPARRQALGPEPIELQVSPQLPGQPTGAPLPRTMQAKIGQTQPAPPRKSSATASQRSSGNKASVWEPPASASKTSTAFRQVSMGRIDLAQIINVPLHHSAIVETLVLDDAPIEVCLAFLPSFDSPQEHDDAG